MSAVGLHGLAGVEGGTAPVTASEHARRVNRVPVWLTTVAKRGDELMTAAGLL
jgi:hypothetical protein